jgi:hypothetical protein
LILLFDENFAPKIVNALRALGYPVDHVLKHVDKGTADEGIFALARDLGAHLVTKDAKIRRRKHEQAAYRSTGIGVFIYTGTAKRTFTDEAVFVISTIERVMARADELKSGFVCEITDRKAVNRLE